MPKQVYHIKAFEGGINKKADPRDIENNELVEITNANVSNQGRIVMSGDGKSSFVTVNAENVLVSPTDNQDGQNRFENETPISSGHGLFSFTHDYDFNDTTDAIEPQQINTEFICVNDGAEIDIWTDYKKLEGNHDNWKDSIISMGTVHNTGTDGNSESSLDVKGVKPIYYKADNGLRVCDANFGEEELTVTLNITINSDATVDVITTAATHGLVVNEYIQIDSEVMKIISISGATITVERKRFGTKIENHDSGAKIFKINVPKVLSHIKRPMLKKTGANVNINRWVQDIQVPEAPKYDALTVFKTNILGFDSTNLNSNGLYPEEPEKVNIGISLNTVETNATLRLKDGSTIASDTTSTETVITIVLASETTPNIAVDVTSSTYNFAIGKFISIEGAEGDGVPLNGVHEIVGFGDAIGEVKIAADTDTVGYEQLGSEIVILEDEIIDDNLKNKYIFGMSFLYDGGGSTLQESNITTGLTNNSPNLTQPNNTFLNIGSSYPKWQSIAGSGSDIGSGSASDLSAVKTNGCDWIGPGLVQIDSNNDWLFYDTDIDNTVQAGTDYYVSGAVTFNSKVETTADIKIYVGIGPGQLTAGGTPISISVPSATFTGTVHFSGIATSHSSVDSAVPVAIHFVNFADGTENVQFHSINVTKKNLEIMSHTNAFDLRQVKNVAKSYLAFLCNNSKTGGYFDITPNNTWNERIEGFRIYMKQVDIIGGGLADEFTMLYDVDLKEGTYVMHAKDSDEEILRLGDIPNSSDGTVNSWNKTNSSDNRAIVTNNIIGDSIKTPPVSTYESENGYKSDTTLAARYKTSAIVERKVYIGNLKIADKTFPDRMLKSDIDKFDTFADDGTHFIDVATSDGESIIALESIGDKLIQFKQKTAYGIKVTSEGEELIGTWSGAGVKNSSQIAKAPSGIFWVNSEGIYFYDGNKLSNVSSNKFTINNWLTNEDFKRPIITGYDKSSNKLIILTTNISGAASSGYIYDISTGAITQHDNLFNWYSLSNPTDTVTGNTESEL